MMRTAIFLGLVLPSLATGQTLWRLPATTGYASLGTTVGLLAVSGTGYDLDALGLIALATVGGGVVGLVSGYRIGAAADRKLARGEALRLRHQNAVRLGTVATFAATGALINVSRTRPVVQVNGSYVEAYSENEALLRGAAVGALAGALVQLAFDPSLRRPAKLRVGFGSDGARGRTTILVGVSR